MPPSKNDSLEAQREILRQEFGTDDPEEARRIVMARMPGGMVKEVEIDHPSEVDPFLLFYAVRVGWALEQSHIDVAPMLMNALNGMLPNTEAIGTFEEAMAVGAKALAWRRSVGQGGHIADLDEAIRALDPSLVATVMERLAVTPMPIGESAAFAADLFDDVIL